MDVGGIAQKKHTPLTKAVCNPMVHTIGREPAHVPHIDVHPPDYPLTHVFPREILFLRLRDITHRANKSRTALPFQRKDCKKISFVQTTCISPFRTAPVASTSAT